MRHLLLLVHAAPPALAETVALCRHVYTRYCHRSRYTLAAQWLEPGGGLREKCLVHRMDDEPMAELIPRAEAQGADRIVLRHCTAVVRLGWLAGLRERCGVRGGLDSMEVLWHRGGLRLGGRAFAPWLAFDLLLRGSELPPALAHPAFRLDVEAPALARELHEVTGCELEAVSLVD